MGVLSPGAIVGLVSNMCSIIVRVVGQFLSGAAARQQVRVPLDQVDAAYRQMTDLSCDEVGNTFRAEMAERLETQELTTTNQQSPPPPRTPPRQPQTTTTDKRLRQERMLSGLKAIVRSSWPWVHDRGSRPGARGELCCIEQSFDLHLAVSPPQPSAPDVAVRTTDPHLCSSCHRLQFGASFAEAMSIAAVTGPSGREDAER